MLLPVTLFHLDDIICIIKTIGFAITAKHILQNNDQIQDCLDFALNGRVNCKVYLLFATHFFKRF